MLAGAFGASPAFTGIDFSPITPVDFPEAILVDYTADPASSCGTTNGSSLIGKLCQEGKIQNLNVSAIGATGEDSIVSVTEELGIDDWLTQVSDFSQMLVFGVQLFFSAVTGGFIVSMITNSFFADELPVGFLIGVQVLIGLMWIGLFFGMTRVGNPENI